MADETEREDGALAPPVEEIHLPGPSYLPPVLAFGVMLMITGLVIGIPVIAIGLILVVVSLVQWIRKTRAEMAELPLEH